MKKFIIFLCISISHLGAISQIVTYNKSMFYFGDSTNTLNSVKGVVQDNSFLYLTLGIVDNSNGQHLGIVKTNLSGDTIKRFEYFNSLFDMPTYPGNTMILDKDSNILVASSCNYAPSGLSKGEDGILFKLNRNLDTLWVKKYSLPDSMTGCYTYGSRNWFTAIKQTLDGGYIVAGNYGLNCDISNQRSYLLKLDSAGNVEWRKVYTSISKVFDIELDSDSGYFLPSHDLSTGIPADLSILKVDKSGDIQWSKKVNINNYPSQPIEIAVLDSIHLIVASVYPRDYPASFDMNLTITKISKAMQQIVWEKNFELHESIQCPTVHQNFSLETKNNEIFIAATADVINSAYTKRGYKGVILKLNSNGDSLWSRYYGIKDFDDNCQFNDFIFTKDGGMMAVGYHVPDNGAYNFGAWLVKMDSLGLCPGSYTVDIEELSPEPVEGRLGLHIYPNPAKDYVHIEFEEAIKETLNIEVYDILGQKVYTTKVEKGLNGLSIDVKELDSGVYLINVVDSKGSVALGKLQVLK